jgi:hypothetical protein
MQRDINSFKRDLMAEGHNRADTLENRRVVLADQYSRLEDLENLDAEIQTKQQAIDLTPVGNPHQAGRLESLSVFSHRSILVVGWWLVCNAPSRSFACPNLWD